MVWSVRRATLCAAVVVLTAGCSPALTMQTAPLRDTSTARVVPIADPEQVNPGQPLVVVAEQGRLSEVSVVGPDGPIDGTLSTDLRRWTSSPRVLGYGESYQITAAAVDSRGARTDFRQTVQTIDPARTFDVDMVMPAETSTVGVGMPIILELDRRVQDRAAVESALTVRTTAAAPIVGAWSWRDDAIVEFRPEHYWPGNIEVQVVARLRGVEGAPGTFGRQDRAFDFAIGPAMVTRVDASTHHATVSRDGAVIATIPITTGKEGFVTRSGVKVIMSKERQRTMDAVTTGIGRGDPEYYRLTVQYAMRVTDSGEFVHAAPWSVGSQGRANVSHGCIGMSLSNAAWLYERTMVGDVVEVTGTGRPQDPGNGITVWNDPWDVWLSKSATGPVRTEKLPSLLGG